MQIAEFQRLIEEIYFEKDSNRGPERSFLWFAEEVGELAEVLRKRERDKMPGEFADVLAWLFTLASMSGIEMEEVIDKYRNGCPYCQSAPCKCTEV